jgi:hypothetical protein
MEQALRRRSRRARPDDGPQRRALDRGGRNAAEIRVEHRGPLAAGSSTSSGPAALRHIRTTIHRTTASRSSRSSTGSCAISGPFSTRCSAP